MVWLLVLVVYLQMDEVHAVVVKRLVALLALVQYRIWVSNNAVDSADVVNITAVVVFATGVVTVTSVYVAVAFSLAVVAAVVITVDVFMTIWVHTAYVTVAFTIITVSEFLLLHSLFFRSILTYFLWMEVPDMGNTCVPIPEKPVALITLEERPLVHLEFIHRRVLIVVVSLVAVAAIGVAVVVTVFAADVTVVVDVSVVTADITVVAADVTVVAADVTVAAADITVVATDVAMCGFRCTFFTLHILLFCSILGYFLRVVASHVSDTGVQFPEQ